MADAATTTGADASTPVSSFAKSLFCGDIPEEMAFPYPTMHDAERVRVRSLLDALGDIGSRYDPRKVEEDRWIGDDVLAEMGEAGLMGLYVPTEYGGQGLSQTGYCRVSEDFGRIDGTLAVVMGVHQSIGMKGIHLYGTDDQKARYLPDLAAGRKLAGFALTEPEAGSDAFGIQTRAEPQSDGSWLLNGEKRWIGNGNRDVVVCFARIDAEHGGGHIALILEGGMEGFDSPFRYDTMGLRGNDLRHLTFTDVKVPADNVLGEPGQGFRIAMEILNNGRMSLGTGSVGGTKKLLDMAIEHVTERRQFDQPISDFELVEDKVSWMVSYLYGLESMSYLTTGMMDAGATDVSTESAMVKIAGTEFLWYAANRVFQLVGGQAYMRDQPYEKIIRDIRIYPIFEGSNDVMRAFVGLSGLKPLGEELSELGSIDLSNPISTIGVVAGYARGRIARGVRPDRITKAHPELERHADALGDQVKALRATSEKLLRTHGKGIATKQLHLKRLCAATTDILAQVGVLSRVTDRFAAVGVEMAAQERYIAETFCNRAKRRVHANLEQCERNDDHRMHAIARIAYEKGEYGHALYG